MQRRNLIINLIVLLTALSLIVVVLSASLSGTSRMGGLSYTQFMVEELQLRIVSPYIPKDVCNYNYTHLIPDCSGRFWWYGRSLFGKRFSTNSAGMRDSEYSVKKPDGTFRILAFGDSYTFGFGVGNGETYPNVLEDKLNGYSNMPFEVLNLGVAGASVDDTFMRMNNYWHYSPDLVIVQTLHNDLVECDETTELIIERLGSDTRERFEQQPLQYLYLLNPEERCSCFLEYLSEIVEKASDESIPLIIYGSGILLNSTGDQLETEGCNFDSEFPHFRVMEPRLTVSEQLSRVDLHPGPEGHRAIADALFPTVIRILVDSGRFEIEYNAEELCDECSYSISSG